MKDWVCTTKICLPPKANFCCLSVDYFPTLRSTTAHTSMECKRDTQGNMMWKRCLFVFRLNELLFYTKTHDGSSGSKAFWSIQLEKIIFSFILIITRSKTEFLAQWNNVLRFMHQLFSTTWLYYKLRLLSSQYTGWVDFFDSIFHFENLVHWKLLFWYEISLPESSQQLKN